MEKIDISNWGEFKIGKLFEIKKGKRLTKAKMKDGNIPFIGSSAMNNGRTALIGNKENLHPGNLITVCYNGSVGATYYQPKPFVASDDVNVLYPKFDLNRNIALFIVPLIEAASYRYDYIDKWRTDLMEKDTIRLPITASGKPDFNYMMNYTQTVLSTAEQDYQRLNKATQKESQKIDISGWGEFHLYDDDLFDIDMGTKLNKSAMTQDNPSINFVGRAHANNGITDEVDIIPDKTIYDAGLLTLSLGGEYLGSCFVQPKPFYTSQNVVVLKPRKKMSLYSKLFICGVIFKEGRMHYKAFEDELNRHIKRDFVIKLPITSTGAPDFTYMESYMKSVMLSAKQQLKVLK